MRIMKCIRTNKTCNLFRKHFLADKKTSDFKVITDQYFAVPQPRANVCSVNQSLLATVKTGHVITTLTKASQKKITAKDF